MAGSFYGGAGYSEARTTAICFSAIGAFFAALGGGASAAAGDTGALVKISTICTVMNIVLGAGYTCANLADSEPWSRPALAASLH